jgi:hypothetical protein
MRWKQARQQLVLTAQMKQHSLRGALPYGTNDGVVAATVSSVLCAGDYAAYLRANDEVTFKTKRANVRFKKGQW